MKTKFSLSKKTIIPLILFISLCFNILYLFNIIDIKINLFPSKNQNLQNKTIKKFIDSPISPAHSNIEIELNDTLKKK